MERVAVYETMRLANDHRYGLWAVPYAMALRLDVADIAGMRDAATAAIRRLVDDGCAYLFKAPFAWGCEVVIPEDELDEALGDDRNWRPRRILSRALVRVGATQKGTEAFLSGEFGNPPPVLRPVKDRGREMELMVFSRDEFLALLIGMPAFAVGAVAGAFLGNILDPNTQRGWEGLTFSQGGFWGLLIGGFIALGIAIVVMRRLIPEVAKPLADTDDVIIDHFMEGPSLNPLDDVGNPRF